MIEMREFYVLLQLKILFRKGGEVVALKVGVNLAVLDAKGKATGVNVRYRAIS